MLNRPYQNDRSDRGIISCFDSKLYFTLVIISQKSIFKVTPSFCFSFVNVFILQKQLLLYISYISLIFLYITNIAIISLIFLYITNIAMGGRAAAATATTAAAAAEEFSELA